MIYNNNKYHYSCHLKCLLYYGTGIGGGGVGDLAIRFVYYRYETDIMFIIVVLLVTLVQVVQTAGDFIAKKTDTR